MRPGGPGIAIAVGNRSYFLPVGRLAFVAPLRESGNELVLARGRVPLLRLAERLGLARRKEETRAVGIDGRCGFYAIAAEEVRWLDGTEESPGLEPLDPDTLWTPEEEAALFPASAAGP